MFLSMLKLESSNSFSTSKVLNGLFPQPVYIKQARIQQF